jgi:acetyl-CoA carboxylase beta subunit
MKLQIKKSANLEVPEKCPQCENRNFLTKLKNKFFFCTNCLIEIKISSKKIITFETGEDGDLKLKKSYEAC